MLKYNNYYFHGPDGIFGYNYESMNLIQILGSKKIIPCGSYLYSDLDDYIYLCDTTKKKIKINKTPLGSGFELFIKNGPGIAIKKDNIDVVDPIYKIDSDRYENTSDLFDEVKHKGNISTDLIEFITFPIFNYNDAKKASIYLNHGNVSIKRDYIRRLFLYENQISYIHSNYKNIPIVNLYTGEYIDEERIEKLIHVLSKQ